MIRLSATFSFQRLSKVKTDVVKQNSVGKEQLLLSTHGDKIITLEELSMHDHAKDCWIAIHDNVYDITDFLDEHPASSDILLEYAGRDATIPFRGSGHSSVALGALDTFLIGQLPDEECIYRNRDSRGLAQRQ